ncbi:MAG: hypothetical protein H8E44_01050 [Planctomycetes bacterium]|nr:hypothetical protein [Planctomycetota bacterium]
MIDDPIVEDVYRAREKILGACNGDLSKWIERLSAAEAQHPDQVVDLEAVRRTRRSAQGRVSDC